MIRIESIKQRGNPHAVKKKSVPPSQAPRAVGTPVSLVAISSCSRIIWSMGRMRFNPQELFGTGVSPSEIPVRVQVASDRSTHKISNYHVIFVRLVVHALAAVPNLQMPVYLLCRSDKCVKVVDIARI